MTARAITTAAPAAAIAMILVFDKVTVEGFVFSSAAIYQKKIMKCNIKTDMVSICVCASLPFDFEGRLWDLIVLIPDH